MPAPAQGSVTTSQACLPLAWCPPQAVLRARKVGPRRSVDGAGGGPRSLVVLAVHRPELVVRVSPRRYVVASPPGFGSTPSCCRAWFRR